MVAAVNDCWTSTLLSGLVTESHSFSHFRLMKGWRLVEPIHACQVIQWSIKIRFYEIISDLSSFCDLPVLSGIVQHVFS